MTARLLTASIASLFVAACSFDRSPLIREQAVQVPSGSHDGDAAAHKSRDGGADAPEEAGAINVDDAAVASMDAAVGGDAAMASDGSSSSDTEADAGTAPDAAAPASDAQGVDSSRPMDPPMPATMGGLECASVTCPFAELPAKQCCTAQSDVDELRARAADRCGLDLRALDSASYGPGCWQRDQPGIVDDRCPSSSSTSGDGEPGCCTEDGQCGSVESQEKLGCRHAPGSELRTCQEPMQTESCDAVGTYGVRFVVDAAWGGRSGGLVGLTDAGRGNIEVFIALSIGEADPTTHAVKATGQVCGVVLPPFYSTTLCEAYLPQFPNAIWESDAVPSLELSGRFECSGAGCVIALEPLTYLLGFEMENPEAPWPSSSETPNLKCPSGEKAQCFPDHDSDGQPGVRVRLATSGMAPATSNACRTGYEYRGAPVSASVAAIFDGVRRADRLQLGARMKLAGSFRLADDCSAAEGSAIAEFVNSRAYGCSIQPGTYNFPLGARAGDNDACNSDEAAFMDANLPVYKLLTAGATPDRNLDLSDRSESRGPVVKLLRLGAAGAAVSCDAVRGAMY